MIRYNNKYNNNALTRPERSYKTRCPQTDRQTDIVTYRAAIAAKNVLWSNNIVEKVLLSIHPSILTFDFGVVLAF